VRGGERRFSASQKQVSEDCVDFKADLKSARYGRYLYSAVEGGVAAEYVSSLQAERAAPPVRTKHTKEFDARVGRPAYPVWIGVFFLPFCSRRS